ncbi:SecY-interacting protein [Photobacterium galatheae]|uniref:Protein Syd n=1 Tax=Photobacterium galatheae TaxID=1654360 RepID=A0A066RS37_9GAMM|nr:SecY-interacting protein [Photobacterium galatheae]KDM90183.1 secretion protein [Photobacterium galatheae]MCM0151219.1 SecY-interacting protein [Photobacterium galatheae]
MNHPVTAALADFSTRFMKVWSDEQASLPCSSDLVGLTSPCVASENRDTVFWQPVAREPVGELTAVEQGIELRLHSDIQAFYGSFFSGDMAARFQTLELDLLQAFSESDFQRLQENILGHLVTQRRLKLKPTVFIGVMAAENQVIAICNLTGNVVLETLGQPERELLAEDVASFLRQLEPVVRVS